MGNSLYSGENLTCVRGGRTVFTGLSFSIDSGEALILEGPNGSGKSSLMRVLSGLLRPRTGTLHWRGTEVTKDPGVFQPHLHYVGHRNAIKPVLTVNENLAYWSGLTSRDEHLLDALEQFNLSPLRDTPGNMLSSGQSRRLALSRLMASQRALWLLDEPSVGLDTASLGQLEKAIAKHREKGGAVIVATHTPIAMDAPQHLNLSDYSPLYNGAQLHLDVDEDSWI